MNQALLDKATTALHQSDWMNWTAEDAARVVLRVAVKACADTLRNRRKAYEDHSKGTTGAEFVELIHSAAVLLTAETEVRALLD